MAGLRLGLAGGDRRVAVAAGLSASALRGARIACQVLIAVAATSRAANAAAVASAAAVLAGELPQPVRRRRRARLHRVAVQVALDVPRQAVGRLVPPRRSFSSAFITIQSRSPRTSRASRAGSVPRDAAIDAVSSVVASRVLGLGGSSSRIRRRTSVNAASRSRRRSSGVVPVSSS